MNDLTISQPDDAFLKEVTPSIFGTKTWFDIWLSHFGDKDSGIWKSQTEANLAVPYVAHRQMIGPLGIKAASGAANSHCARFDVMGRIENPGRSFAEMMGQLDVSMLTFPYLSPNSTLHQAFKGKSNGLNYRLAFCEGSPYVNCRMPWDDYWKSRSKHSREDWGRQERKLFKKNAALIRLNRWEEIAPLLPEIYAIEASGWKGRQGTAMAQSETTREFYSNLIERLAQEDQIRVFLLRVDNQHVAFKISAFYRGVLTTLKIGYRDEYAQDSPGHVLKLQVLRWAFENPDVHIFDMAGPATPYKVRWATHVENLQTLRIFRNNPTGLLAWGRFVCAPAVKSRLAPLGLSR